MKFLTHGIATLGTNLRAALSLFGKTPTTSANFSFDPGMIAGLLALLLVVESAIAFVFLYPAVRFSVWGLHSFALFTCSLFIITWLLVAISKTQWQFPRILTMWVSGLVCLLPLKFLNTLGQTLHWPLFLTVFIVVAAILLNILLLYRISRWGLYHSRLKSAFASVFATVLFVGFNNIVPDTDIWVYDWRSELYDSEAEPDYVNTENVYYKQAALIEQATRNIAPQRSGVKDIYFLGFGGEGDNVFKSETLAVQSIVDKKLGTKGRSTVLINNANTVDAHPIASVHNLRELLREIGTKMNPEEDVLMMYLTSHGSRDHKLSVELDYLDLNMLPAEELASIVHSTPIKWKVIVVSACFSGGFIKPLKDEYTVVITAARHDRTSFGCQSENEYTYFGNAYFNEAIRDGNNILESFSKAKTSIAMREREEELTPSEPQIFVGAKVNGYFDDLSTDLPYSVTDLGQHE